PFGAANLGNLRAVTGAAARTILIGAFGPEREFSRGAATAIVAALSERGAVVVDDADGAILEVERLTVKAAGRPPAR
ncbi:MAG TPA: hypothetical protein VFH17_03955, partial [Coriobacteriia bacterium]|nr:hypothetical protein [Coriobacteriia bacterium]